MSGKKSKKKSPVKGNGKGNKVEGSTSKNPAADNRVPEIVEQIASTAVMLEPSDQESTGNLSSLFELLGNSLPDDAEDEVVESIITGQSIIDGIRDKESDQAEEELEKLYQCISLLQRSILSEVNTGEYSEEETSTSSGESGSPDKQPGEDNKYGQKQDDTEFSLPDWVDEGMFQEFISSQKSLLEEVETSLLDLESGKDVDLADLKGRIHTMKGDTGMVGLDDMGRVYHAVEDFLADTGCAREGVDVLLSVKDWLDKAIESYKKFGKPSPPADEIIETLVSRRREVENFVSGEEDASSAGAEDRDEKSDQNEQQEEAKSENDQSDSNGKSEPEQHPCSDQSLEPEEVSAKVERDEETIALIEDFIEESEEGITNTDEILLDIENNAEDPEKINSIFRTFHTIKGVAGFLDFDEIQTLSHKTETMLNRVRNGEIKLEGKALDVTFDSTEMMRQMIANVKSAVENSENVGSVPGLKELIRRLEAVISGDETIAPAEQGDKSSPEEWSREMESNKPAGTSKSRDKSRKKQVQIKEYIRVDSHRLDELVDTIGELVISESMVFQSDELQEMASPTLQKRMVMLDKITRQLQGMGTSLKMIPVKGIFQKMARLVRDLSRKSGKQVTMTMKGKDTELDKSVVDKIGDPLVHMIRNAVDHGIETAQERRRAGKREQGTVCLAAYHKGGYIYIEVKDDGCGLNKESIIDKAINRGLINENHSLSDKEIYNLIFEPGFSTAKKVTEVSGRGVGMDVVKRNIESLRGRVDIRSEPGRGSTFTIRLPLTMAIIDGMVVRVGSESYIIPTLSISRSLRPQKEDIVSVFEQGEMIKQNGKLIELFRLHRFFHIQEAKENPTEALVVIVEDNGKQIGILVDELVGQQQIVIKSLSETMDETEGISGATIMPDGTVGLILDTSKIIKLYSGKDYKSGEDNTDIVPSVQTREKEVSEREAAASAE